MLESTKKLPDAVDAVVARKSRRCESRSHANATRRKNVILLWTIWPTRGKVIWSREAITRGRGALRSGSG